jgi:hypothetical protein
MQSRAARLILLALFLSAIGVSGFLFWRGEAQASAEAAAARTFDTAARSLARTILDFRAAQQSYVAAGQGGDFWGAKVASGLDKARAELKAMRAAAIPAGAQPSLDALASTLEDFARVDKRALQYVRDGQKLLASDVIFADGLELTEAALTALEQARTSELQAREDGVATFRRRQTFAVAAGAAAAVLAVLLLVPSSEARSPAVLMDRSSSVRAPEPQRAVVPLDSRGSEEGWSPPRRTTVAADAAEASPSVAPSPASDPAEPSAPVVALTNPPPPVPPMPATDFTGLAALCVDLAQVADTRALPSLLDRAATLLDASGIILWIADPDGRELNPIFAQGYPPQLVNRLGTIPKDAENATAAAFRTSLLQTVRADQISDGAIAAPLVTPGGCVGVMAAEVRHEAERLDATLAAATIVAAQLATLVGPPSARSAVRTGTGA